MADGTGMDARAILRVSDLKMHYPIEQGFMRKVTGHVRAVDGVSFDLYKGETLGLVGESGCGKTTLGRCVMRALAPTSGEVLFRKKDGAVVDLMRVDKQTLRSLRREMQMIFQDPIASLDERMTVFDCIAEPLVIQKTASGVALKQIVEQYANMVGLNLRHLNRYPHSFSGGQRQRVGIARALITAPSLIVADEPVSALDVSIQAQIINLLQDIQKETGITLIFVSHDLRVVHYICDRVAVMYVGKLVELAETDALYDNPMHPYTRVLLSSLTEPDPRKKNNRKPLAGEVPNPANPPPGCAFHPRCAHCQDICMQETPPLAEAAPGHFCACHFPQIHAHGALTEA